MERSILGYKENYQMRLLRHKIASSLHENTAGLTETIKWTVNNSTVIVHSIPDSFFAKLVLKRQGLAVKSSENPPDKFFFFE